MRIRTALPIAVCAAFVAGCSVIPGGQALTPNYKPANVHVRAERLPPSLRRVLVLPVIVPPGAQEPSDPGWVQPLLMSELGKSKRFELVTLSRDELRTLTGKTAWAAEDELPTHFFARLREATACDGVIFAALTTFQAYPPLRTGWKVRLVDCQDEGTVWAIDEVFDAGLASVAAAARSYARKDMNLPTASLDDGSILQSPRRFTQYTASAVVHTLPTR